MWNWTTERLATVPPTLWWLLLLGFFLRLIWIDVGLPYDFMPDEIHEILRALKLGIGEYVVDSQKGGLYLILFFEYSLLFLFLLVIGSIKSPGDFAVLFIEDPFIFYILGRFTVAILGTLTLLFVFFACRKLTNSLTAIVATFFGSLSTFHVIWSHFINVDIGLALFLTVSFFFLVRHEHDNWRGNLVLSGVCCGLACGFKITGLLGILPFLLSQMNWQGLGPIDGFNPRRFMVFFGSLLIGILVIAPETLITLPELSSHFSEILTHASNGGDINLPAANESYSDKSAVTILIGATYWELLTLKSNVVLTILTVLGVIYAGFARRRWLFICGVTAIAYVSVLTLADRPATERYLVPIMPFVWILSAAFISAVSRDRPLVLTALLIVASSAPITSTFMELAYLGRVDSRVMAKQWVEQNVPSGAKLLMDGMDYRFIQSPPLTPDQGTVLRLVGQAEIEGAGLSRGVTPKMLRLFEEGMARREGPRYALHSTRWGRDVKSIDLYASECFDYLILSSDIKDRYDMPSVRARFPDSVNFYDGVADHRRTSLVYSTEAVDRLFRGPNIWIYSLNKDPHCDL